MHKTDSSMLMLLSLHAHSTQHVEQNYWISI